MGMRRLTPQEEQFYSAVDAVMQNDDKAFNQLQSENAEKFPEIFGPLSHFRYEYITHKKAVNEKYVDIESDQAKSAMQQLESDARKYADKMMQAITEGNVDSYQFKWGEEHVPEAIEEPTNNYQLPNYQSSPETPMFEAVNRHIQHAIALDLAILNPSNAPQIITDQPHIRGPYALYQAKSAGASTPSEVSALEPLRANLVQMTLSHHENDKQAVANLNEKFDKSLNKEQGNEIT